MKADLFLWRPVIAGLISFRDLDSMTFVDLLDAHEILNAQEYVQSQREVLNGRK